MGKLNVFGRLALRVFDRHIRKIVIALKSDEKFKANMVKRINAKVDLPYLSDKQEEAVIALMLDSFLDLLVNLEGK